jgi:hypothetical protein
MPSVTSLDTSSPLALGQILQTLQEEDFACDFANFAKAKCRSKKG